MTLEEYFKLIVNKPPVKEQPMNFLKLSMFFTEQLEKIKNLWTKPVAFVEQEVLDEDYWAFEMYTGKWVDENGETVHVKHTYIIEPNETTWMEVLDRILEEMEKHYGYNIKDQVYYSLQFPLNEINPLTGKPVSGYGRSLNDEVLQQLLLAFPEVYTVGYFNGPSKEVFK